MVQSLVLDLNILQFLRIFESDFLYEMGLLLYMYALFLSIKNSGLLICTIKKQLAYINSLGYDIQQLLLLLIEEYMLIRFIKYKTLHIKLYFALYLIYHNEHESCYVQSDLQCLFDDVWAIILVLYKLKQKEYMYTQLFAQL